ncbi:DUF4225 domain-containing protein [Erwinia tracheiphila]|uniref:DUF4225 domain-containing protein n=1 Tax=Erwinia tracheiphila TaxID=65700 RepID=A0A0M2K625_9GAMM|nr:DUF4225 domain-containing protein [Erwinia tracheiphila]EOS96701.1 hypothetical protein ETR_01361 [Erwinia tracheiphila PSU-1]KKF34830.1 hypothetical protein SY86_04330 [Erwinia tracheiphila]UIA86495.1 DUF4225 domain-containing protein [Erwinia tracheiphila]UIA94848.1 DUF4225 domain-containing protein [Erwinia tracheiphila]
MDAALLDMMRSGGRNKAWTETMVNLEARKLINTANTLSAFHLRDGLTRMNFVQEIKEVIEQQFAAARRAKSDEECMDCVKNLMAETENFEEQGRMLRTKSAKLYAKVEFVRENNKIVGYVISAVNVVVSGVVIFGGFVMLSTMGPIGMLAGAVLIVDGMNGLSKEVIDFAQPTGYRSSQGIAAESVMQTAQFMGFSPKTGLVFYNGITLGASAYSIFGLARKAGAWRLFRWMPRDYYRKVETMSRPKLTMKIVGYGVKAKVIFDLLTTDNGNS